MAIERKAILSTLSDNKQLVLPTTASVSGYDLNTGNLVYFNTGSNEWSVQETISGSSGIFADLTASNLRLTGNPGTIVNEVGPLLISSSLGITTSGSIIFSGSRSDLGTDQTSVLVNGDIFVSGGIGTNDYLQLKPVDLLRIPTNTTSSYIYTSGSTNDLYFTQYSGPYTNTTRLRWLEGGLSTGLLHGGLLSTESGTTAFSVTSGSGIVVSMNASTTTDPYPTVQLIDWPTYTSQSLTYSSSAQITYVGINPTNSQIIQQTTPFVDGDFLSYISLGYVLHQTGSVTSAAKSAPFVSYGRTTSHDHFVRSFGALKISGHVLAASGSTLSLTKSAGDAYYQGRNYTTNPSDPDYVKSTTDFALTNSKIFREYVNSLGNPVIDSGIADAGYTVIDPTKYNNNGTLASVPGGRYTIQRVYWFPNSVTRALYVYYGSATYTSLDVAQAAIATENFTEGQNTLDGAILVAYLIVSAIASDLTNTSQARFIQAGLFRNIVGAGGAGGSSTVPGGLDTYVQFNDGGSTFGGVSTFTFNKTSNTLSTTNIQVSGIVGASGSVTLGDASSDIVTVTGQLTASQGISASSNISTAGNLLVQGTTQITGSLIASRITGSLSGTVAGNPFIVAGSGITTNYNSIGQWEVTGSGGGFTASELVALTQATNTELNDDSLAYVVIDPSGTPISRKSTIARMGTLPESYLEMVGLHQTISTPASGDYTIGVRFYPARASQECTGVRVYWRGTSSVTLKLALYEANVGGTLQSGSVTTTTTPGIYSVTFGSTVALDPKKLYIASCYETSGSVFLNYAANISILTPPLRFRDYHLTDSYYYATGDANPGLAFVGYVVELEPLISG